MIVAGLLSLWDKLVCVAALVAMIVIAFSLMVRVVTVGHAVRHLGTVILSAILLIMLPPIILSIWSTLSFGQQAGIGALAFLALLFLGAVKTKRPRKE